MSGHAARLLVGLSIAIGLSGCHNGVTSFVEVPVSGIPHCKAGSMLRRPVVVDLRSGDDSSRRYFMGAADRDAINVPKQKRRWAARFGLCRNETSPKETTYQCGDVDWYGKRSVTLDATRPGATIAVPKPPKDGCWTRTSSAP